MPEMGGYVKTFKFEEGNKDRINRSMSFPIDDEKLLEKYKTIQNKIEKLKNIKSNGSPVYDEGYIYKKNKNARQ